MPLADSNIWLALALSKHAFHSAAQTLLTERKPREALFCRSTQQSFFRLLTTRAVLAPYRIPPLSNKSAWSIYAALRADERISWVDEPSGLEVIWKKFAEGSKAPPNYGWTLISLHLHLRADISW